MGVRGGIFLFSGTRIVPKKKARGSVQGAVSTAAPRISKLSALVVAMFQAGCVVGTRARSVPDDGEPVVLVASQALGHSMSELGRHSWIATRRRGEKRFVRWEVAGVASARDGDPFEPQCGCSGDSPASADVRLHAVVRGDRATAITACLEDETRRYNQEHDYGFWPGPNCNTYVATMARRCEIHVELPATAVGRDHRGIVGAGVTSGATGVQLESPVVGAKIGITEGVEVHLFGAALGVDFWPPALIVPLGPGRLGFDDR